MAPGAVAGLVCRPGLSLLALVPVLDRLHTTCKEQDWIHEQPQGSSQVIAPQAGAGIAVEE